MEIKFDVKATKRFILSNKKKCLKFTGIAFVLIVALTMYATGSLTNKGDIVLVDISSDEIAYEETDVPAATTEKTASDAEVQQEDELMIIDIEGAVNFPGVVYLNIGSRVNDAVKEAGGLTGDANTRNVNLAARLTDGDKVYIPKQGEEKNTAVSNSEPAGIITNIVSGGSQSGAGDSSTANPGVGANGMVNINTATAAQLQTLSGVGPATAQKIIEYRETTGEYTRIEDIMRVSGIGVKTFEKFKDKITI